MMTKNVYILIALIFLFCCSDKRFDSELWRRNDKEKYYMLNDIVKNKRLIGKSKDEIIRQLDTVDIKQYDYNDSVWMYVIEKPYSTRATENAIVVMDIEFEDELVSTIELRK